jgi:Arc/MetJ-type ribon-helix-helix transcriptional regulator
MKDRASFTFDKETLDLIDNLINLGIFRNRSHVVEEAIKHLKEKTSNGVKK